MKAANELLKSIGMGINLNMTDVVTKQVRATLEKFKSEIASAAQNSGKGFSDIGAGAQSADTQIKA